jgi:hypothetical protein
MGGSIQGSYDREALPCLKVTQGHNSPGAKDAICPRELSEGSPPGAGTEAGASERRQPTETPDRPQGNR